MFRHGFKTWCETIATQKRRSLNVPITGPLDPRVLATDMDVIVLYIEQVPHLAPGTIEQLTLHDPESWSAVTVCWKNKYLIVMNSAHANTRQASSLMHELAHIIIGHKPARLDITPDGLMVLSSYDKQHEEEANWLAAALLLPREALLYTRHQGMTNEDTATLYGCSTAIVAFRINTTGVDLQVRRARKHRH